MIIKKRWVTYSEKRYFHWNGKIFNSKESHWEGYFLFGIIPLYVKNTNNLYSDN